MTAASPAITPIWAARNRRGTTCTTARQRRPGRNVVIDPTQWRDLGALRIRDLVRTFANDERIFIWDLTMSRPTAASSRRAMWRYASTRRWRPTPTI